MYNNDHIYVSKYHYRYAQVETNLPDGVELEAIRDFDRMEITTGLDGKLYINGEEGYLKIYKELGKPESEVNDLEMGPEDEQIVYVVTNIPGSDITLDESYDKEYIDVKELSVEESELKSYLEKTEQKQEIIYLEELPEDFEIEEIPRDYVDEYNTPYDNTPITIKNNTTFTMPYNGYLQFTVDPNKLPVEPSEEEKKKAKEERDKKIAAGVDVPEEKPIKYYTTDDFRYYIYLNNEPLLYFNNNLVYQYGKVKDDILIKIRKGTKIKFIASGIDGVTLEKCITESRILRNISIGKQQDYTKADNNIKTIGKDFAFNGRCYVVDNWYEFTYFRDNWSNRMWYIKYNDVRKTVWGATETKPYFRKDTINGQWEIAIPGNHVTKTLGTSNNVINNACITFTEEIPGLQYDGLMLLEADSSSGGSANSKIKINNITDWVTWTNTNHVLGNYWMIPYTFSFNRPGYFLITGKATEIPQGLILAWGPYGGGFTTYLLDPKGVVCVTAFTDILYYIGCTANPDFKMEFIYSVPPGMEVIDIRWDKKTSYVGTDSPKMAWIKPKPIYIPPLTVNTNTSSLSFYHNTSPSSGSVNITSNGTKCVVKSSSGCPAYFNTPSITKTSTGWTVSTTGRAGGSGSFVLRITDDYDQSKDITISVNVNTYVRPYTPPSSSSSSSRPSSSSSSSISQKDPLESKYYSGGFVRLGWFTWNQNASIGYWRNYHHATNYDSFYVEIGGKKVNYRVCTGKSVDIDYPTPIYRNSVPENGIVLTWTIPYDYAITHNYTTGKYSYLPYSLTITLQCKFSGMPYKPGSWYQPYTFSWPRA